jgi:hypothetical protein
LHRTPCDTADERLLDLNDYADWLRGLSDKLLDDVHRLADESDDETTRELLRKITQLISVNQSMITLNLLSFRLHMRENEAAIDSELYEISEYMAEILNIHRREAENLRKIL